MDASSFVRGLLDDQEDPQQPQYVQGNDFPARAYGLLDQLFPDPYKAAGDAVKQYRGGDVLGAFETMFGSMPTTGAITAYHGSPHSFDKFSLDKIGTGEGAQAYGHGLYFADNEAVAHAYRDALSGMSYSIDGTPASSGLKASEAIWNMSDLPEQARYQAGWHINRDYPLTDALQHLETVSPTAHAALKAAMDAGRISEVKNPGHMYQVKINADPEKFLDYDSPISAQPPAARAYMDQELRRYLGSAYAGQISNFEGKAAGDILEQSKGRAFTSPEVAAEIHAAGIPGIRYLDEGSRGTGEGSRNYVVFDDSLIDILKKYGLAGLLGGGAASYATGNQQAQPAPLL